MKSVITFLGVGLMALSSFGQWQIEAYESGLQINGQSRPEGKKLDWKGFEFIANVQLVTQQGGAQLRSADGTIWVGPHSHLLWKAQDTVFELKAGQVRSQAKVNIRFELGECQWVASNDIAMKWDPLQFTVNWKVLQGEWAAPCFDFESQIPLSEVSAGAQFISDKIKGEWAFDELASGKRMPRGVLKALGSQESDPFNFNWQELEKTLQLKKKPAEHVRVKKEPKFCRSPEANPGQCVYRCQQPSGQFFKYKKGALCDEAKGFRCQRSSCSVEGKWVDSFDLSREVPCPTPWDRASQCM